MLAAVAQAGWALEYASVELKNDEEVVLAAVAQDGRALVYASAELRNDKEVVLAAVAQDGDALVHASAELKNDKEVVLAAVAQDGKALKYASQVLQVDWDVICAAHKMPAPGQEEEALKAKTDSLRATVVNLEATNKALLAKVERLEHEESVTVINVDTDEVEATFVAKRPRLEASSSSSSSSSSSTSSTSTTSTTSLSSTTTTLSTTTGLQALAQHHQASGARLIVVKQEKAAAEQGKAAAERGAEDAQDRLLCVVCSDAPRRCIYLPCAHFSTCEICDEKFIESGMGECPICQEDIGSRIRGVHVP
jgi:hypothetical protein